MAAAAPWSAAGATFLAPRADATGRRWRWAVPWPRVALSAALVFGGGACAISGLALPSLAAGVAGALMLVPGVWAARVYAGVLLRGEAAAAPAVFFDEVEVDGENGDGGA